MGLRICYAVSGTDVPSAATRIASGFEYPTSLSPIRLRARYAKSGTDIACPPFPGESFGSAEEGGGGEYPTVECTALEIAEVPCSIFLCACYAMPGTDAARRGTRCNVHRPARAKRTVS
eukprot:196445-Rhodomonas_salina.3